jgi:hypothetical protein
MKLCNRLFLYQIRMGTCTHRQVGAPPLENVKTVEKVIHVKPISHSTRPNNIFSKPCYSVQDEL